MSLFAWKPRHECPHQTDLTEVNKCKIECQKQQQTLPPLQRRRQGLHFSSQRLKLKDSPINASWQAHTSQGPTLSILYFVIPGSAQSEGWYMPVFTVFLLASLK